MKLNIFEKIWFRGICQIPAYLRDVKWSLQRFFRGYSDITKWDFYSEAIRLIYPAFKAFYKAEKRGVAMDFFDNPVKIDTTDEEHEKAVQNFQRTLEDILFAMEYSLYDNDYRGKRFKKYFEKKYGNMYEETPENRHDPLTYWTEDLKTGERVESTMFDGEPIYYNSKMWDDFRERQQKGFELMGKHFLSFWD